MANLLPHLWRVKLCPLGLINRLDGDTRNHRSIGYLKLEVTHSTHRNLPQIPHVAEVMGITTTNSDHSTPAPALLSARCYAFPLRKKRQSWFVVLIFSPGINLGLLSSALATSLLLGPICACSPHSPVSLINLYRTSNLRLEARIINDLHSPVSTDML